jgi:hypothetical protein
MNLSEIGQTVVLEDLVYTIDASFTKSDVDFTYRTLKTSDNLSYASIWAKNGEQLLYKSNKDLLTLSGDQTIIIVDVINDHTISLILSNRDLMVYDLEQGIIEPA